MRSPGIRLVGSLYQGPREGVIEFLHRAFGRVREVQHAKHPLRQVQYVSPCEDYLHFLAVEVDTAECVVPDGMVAWDVSESSWRINGAGGKVWGGPVEWRWCVRSVSGRACGEFSAMCPGDWQRDGRPSARRFEMWSNSYPDAPCDDGIVLVEYDPSWPAEYEEMRERVMAALGKDVALRIEHYGSTAIPGTAAKPVIDILIAVPSFEAARKRGVPAFDVPSIEYWLSASDHMKFYVRDEITGVRTHHLHIAPRGHQLWDGIVFRDYLRAHPGDVARYVALKRELADRHSGDRLAYTNAKEAFVREILEKARQSPSS